MKIKLLKRYTLILIGVVALYGSTPLQAQNLLTNGDFELNSGSLEGWTIASATNTTIVKDINNNSNARLSGENGVLYQKVSITPGKTYQCTINFASISPKQTTGYGFAIEKTTLITFPTFTSGATQLQSICSSSNSGTWTNLTAVEGATQKVFSIVAPSQSTAIYICIGTKGATASLAITDVVFEEKAAVNVSFLLKNKTTGALLSNAEVAIEGIAQLAISDVNGVATTKLIPSTTPYQLTIECDWYKKTTSQITVTDPTPQLEILLDPISEVKKVETRISKYNDNATPYPLYAHMWSSGFTYDDANITKLTSAFDYIIGGGGIENQATTSNKLHLKDPNFQVISYKGGWVGNRSIMESDKKNILYYRVGTLSAAIDATQTTLVLTKPTDNKGLGLLASEEGNFTTWIRLKDELLKVTAVSSKDVYPITVTVERGMDGTTPIAHTIGTTATMPVYATIPVPSGSNGSLSYFNPVWGPRKSSLTDETFKSIDIHAMDGIWIDILVGLLDAKSILGGNYTLWNHETEAFLTNTNIIAKTKDAVAGIANKYYSRRGFYPVIYGNNVLYSSALTPSDRGYTMVKTTEHPRVIDGICHENSWGHMTEDAGAVDNDGNPVPTNDVYKVTGSNSHYLEWYMGTTWINNSKAIALLAENNLPNQPAIINAGFKNDWFAKDLTDEVRYNFNKFCYASYLMCVNVTSDKAISCRMGLSPMRTSGSTSSIVIEPFFYYQIGTPTQNIPAATFTQYRVGTSNLYARKFSNGIVLLNPFSSDMTAPVLLSDITGAPTEFIDPENNNASISQVQLASRESKILLFSTTNIKSNKSNSQVSVYPIPANDRITIQVKGVIKNSDQPISLTFIDISGRIVKQTEQTFNSGSAVVDIADLSKGVYIIHIGNNEYKAKVIKN